jgi:hypothetical protein
MEVTMNHTFTLWLISSLSNRLSNRLSTVITVSLLLSPALFSLTVSPYLGRTADSRTINWLCCC